MLNLTNSYASFVANIRAIISISLGMQFFFISLVGAQRRPPIHISIRSVDTIAEAIQTQKNVRLQALVVGWDRRDHRDAELSVHDKQGVVYFRFLMEDQTTSQIEARVIEGNGTLPSKDKHYAFTGHYTKSQGLLHGAGVFLVQKFEPVSNSYRSTQPTGPNYVVANKPNTTISTKPSPDTALPREETGSKPGLYIFALIAFLLIGSVYLIYAQRLKQIRKDFR